MIQQEKQLLLKDLCMRIPYRTFVCLNPGAYNKPETCILTGVDGEQVHLNVDSDPFKIDHIKPYLRPMSSMTKEESKEFTKLCHSYYEPKVNGVVDLPYGAGYDWLLAHHFDYRNLIKKDLALEAPANMYKIE